MMRSRNLSPLLPLVALLLCGCWETKETVTLNPDGSGKVAFETITAIELNLNSEPLFDYPAESKKAKDAQDKMLETLNIALKPANPEMNPAPAPPPPGE